ncbi:GPI-GlcNAc transferase complex, PIG-H component-domain-containing protein [Halteromyces radiatus]|uniref:GPI-GlcNAc transferase complex, PIG-H component-domain-containing protein n=1 Tax=Halteromyces radiatus TaxID=101107 RepID=UPI00221E423E|nr:GPI-GlcNAc transferase complex, PIG-H component-domain-containing protein [Halteromyces radiatus]KAI8099395.1 GPI-GlcNAc transferase complex, PIG-H component-domain-containing protein [Halteromyces radiatus]
MSFSRDERSGSAFSDIFSSKVLPGGNAHEYTVVSNRPFMTMKDIMILLLMIVGLFIWMNKTTHWAWMIVVGWIWIKLKNVKQESLLIMRDIGIQVKTTYWSGRTESKFINRLKIQNVVINEGIHLWQVKPYMAILVKDQEKMLIVFENLLPPLHPVLLTTYRGTRRLLFPSDDND